MDDGLGFQLVPWRPALEQRLGQNVSGALTPGGGIDWSANAGSAYSNINCPLFVQSVSARMSDCTVAGCRSPRQVSTYGISKARPARRRRT
ncbi:MAG TPA: DUF3363 domain-containing protein [Roseiarcus sp.]|nr:DUF3363 domain-containing protein [Roseiarcus sp.]